MNQASRREFPAAMPMLTAAVMAADSPGILVGSAEEDELARCTDPALVDFLMDAGHGYLGGGDPPRFLSHHASRVFGFHIKTYRGKHRRRGSRPAIHPPNVRRLKRR